MTIEERLRQAEERVASLTQTRARYAQAFNQVTTELIGATAQRDLLLDLMADAAGVEHRDASAAPSP